MTIFATSDKVSDALAVVGTVLTAGGGGRWGSHRRISPSFQSGDSSWVFTLLKIRVERNAAGTVFRHQQQQSEQTSAEIKSSKLNPSLLWLEPRWQPWRSSPAWPARDPGASRHSSGVASGPCPRTDGLACGERWPLKHVGGSPALSKFLEKFDSRGFD